MYLVWIGVALLIAKVFAIGPVADLSWMWVIAPFIAALLWFEAFESALGLDKRKKNKEQEKEQEKARRIREQFNTSPKKS